jgi:hypothetical protein
MKRTVATTDMPDPGEPSAWPLAATRPAEDDGLRLWTDAWIAVLPAAETGRRPRITDASALNA